jgi:hypothetical protein
VSEGDLDCRQAERDVGLSDTRDVDRLEPRNPLGGRRCKRQPKDTRHLPSPITNVVGVIVVAVVDVVKVGGGGWWWCAVGGCGSDGDDGGVLGSAEM